MKGSGGGSKAEKVVASANAAATVGRNEQGK